MTIVIMMTFWFDFCYYIKTLTKSDLGVGEMAQQLRALAVLPKDLAAIPAIHMAVYNCLGLQSQGI